MTCLFLHSAEREDFLGGDLLVPRQKNSPHQAETVNGAGDLNK